jgi:transposase
VGKIGLLPSTTGKPFKVAMTACMHKLLVILNAMVKTNRPWQVAA